MRDTGQTPSRTRREVLAGLVFGATAWTAPQVLSVARAGAMSQHTITLDPDGARIDGGPPVPFTWSVAPFDAGASDISDGGQIQIDTAGCVPIAEPLELPAIPYANGTCPDASGDPDYVQGGTIIGNTVSFPVPPDNPVQCLYLDFTLTIECSS